MSITYLGHSCFLIEENNHKILIDPFLICVPNFSFDGITDILLTHGHGDHLGSAIEISQKTGAKIIAIFELANYCNQKGANAQGIGFGSWIEYEWGKLIAVPATHTSSTPDNIYAGNPCGFILDFGEFKIYHAGDTGLNSEMKIIGELYSPDVAMLPVGGFYTMDIEHAVIASKWLDSSVVIPMHYNTFEQIKVDIKDFERQIRSIGKMPLIMKISETLQEPDII